MAEFSAADAAFTGFRVVWERPWAAAIWAGVQFLVNVMLRIFIVASTGTAVTQLMESLLQPQTKDPASMLALFRQVAPAEVAMLFVGLVVSAVFYAAMNRAVIRPQESRFGYLRLAADELRQLGLLVTLFLVFFAVEVMAAIVWLSLLSLFSLALGPNSAFGVGLLVLILAPATLFAFIYVGVRLSLASPLTFVTGRIDLGRSWRMTRGRFWPLLGAYFIAAALNLVVLALILVIAFLAVGILSGGLAGTAGAMQGDSLAAVLTPAQLTYLAIVSIGAALSAPITTCPPAAIYLALTNGHAQGKVFD